MRLSKLLRPREHILIYRVILYYINFQIIIYALFSSVVRKNNNGNAYY